MRQYQARPDLSAELPRMENGDFPAELRLSECAAYLSKRHGIKYANARQRLYNALRFGLIRIYAYHDTRNNRIMQPEAKKPCGEWLIETPAFVEYAEGKRHRKKIQ